MDRFKDFTFDPKNFPLNEMQAMVADLHEKKQHYVLIVDPAIKVEKGYGAYDDGVAQNLFIKNPDGTDFVGKVWPEYFYCLFLAKSYFLAWLSFRISTILRLRAIGQSGCASSSRCFPSTDSGST
jgi:alpha-glucosidase (family GH31 glycosyl hydrolase)